MCVKRAKFPEKVHSTISRNSGRDLTASPTTKTGQESRICHLCFRISSAAHLSGGGCSGDHEQLTWSGAEADSSRAANQPCFSEEEQTSIAKLFGINFPLTSSRFLHWLETFGTNTLCPVEVSGAQTAVMYHFLMYSRQSVPGYSEQVVPTFLGSRAAHMCLRPAETNEWGGHPPRPR